MCGNEIVAWQQNRGRDKPNGSVITRRALVVAPFSMRTCASDTDAPRSSVTVPLNVADVACASATDAVDTSHTAQTLHTSPNSRKLRYWREVIILLMRTGPTRMHVIARPGSRLPE